MASKVAFLRFSLAIFAILNAAAHLYPSPSGSMAGQFYFNLEVILYSVIALMFVLGLKRWYAIATVYSVLNIALFIIAGTVTLPGITGSALTSNLDFMHYDISRLFSVVSYIYLIFAGLVLIKLDKGSKIERLY
ncbi:MAG: hypothetical protein KGH49_03495 [Candidatus Micrarchaeota archaeon]|nr:hypothetical protein [Candidatus Micrarchaeota archaeon]